MSDKKIGGKKIFHVELKDGTHKYFGSIAAIYEVFSSEQLGVVQSSLYDYDITPDKPYSNKICTIYEGKIVRKKGNRKKPE